MKITEDKFPILGCVKNNILTEKISEFVDRQVSDKNVKKEILDSVKYFKNKKLQVNYITNPIHEIFLDTSKFIKAKELLKNSPPTVGLLLLPSTVFPDFTYVPDYVKVDREDYPINAILYSWQNINEHDKISGDSDPEDPWDENNRELLILPIYNAGTTQATKQLYMFSEDELYGVKPSEDETRFWYGNIHDYVMSFILFYNYTEPKIKILYGADNGKQKRITMNNGKFLNLSENAIGMFDSSNFTIEETEKQISSRVLTLKR
ncbi:MAG: hypothetical protein AB2L20_07150 [Mangrovibacterium sp.]